MKKLITLIVIFGFAGTAFAQQGVGIGTNTPVEKLDVDGAIKLGNTTTTNAGTIRWTGSAFEGYDGSAWVVLSGGVASNNWTVSANDIYNANIGNVGVGVASPQQKLDVDGAINLGTTTTTSAGAIRWTGTDFEGYDGSAWVSLTGAGSTAGAFETTAGVTSNSPGATGTDDFVFGSPQLTDDGNSQHDARIIFDKNVAAFRAGIAQGTQWDAPGYQSTAFGLNAQATGLRSMAWGANAQATNDYTTSFGTNTQATGIYATSSGYHTIASGTGSIASGYQNEATGHYSNAGGVDNVAPSYGETSMGTFATNYTANSNNSWNATDRVFSVGNGTSDAARSNALTIYKDGTMNINDAYDMPTTDGTVGQVMTTNGAGGVSWQDAAGGADDLGNHTATTDLDMDGNQINDLGAPTLGTDAATKAYVDAHTDADGDAANELQTLSISGSDVTLSNGGGTVTIPNDGDWTVSGADQYAATTGNVGIGTTTPSAKLEVTGNFEVGSNVTAGPQSLAGGFMSNSPGGNSIAYGTIAAANGGNSAALGQRVTANGNRSFATGFFTTAESRSEAVFGEFNSAYTPVGGIATWNTSDRLFVVGNGTSNANRNNALTITKDGTMNINEAYDLPNAAGTTGQVLTVDGSGNAIWAAPAADGDADASNELQTLSQTGTNVTLSNGGGTISVADNDNDSSNEIQDLSSSSSGTNRTINIAGGTGTTISVADNDNDAANELQTMSISGSDLTLSNGGGTITLPADGDGDASNELQTLSQTGTNVTLSNGGGTISVADNDNDSSNEIQDLSSSSSGTNRTINIAGGTGTTISVSDNDNDSSNEIQTVSISGSTVSLSNGGGSITLPAGADNLGNHAATTDLDMNTNKITDLGTPTAAADAATKAYVDAHTDADSDASNEIQDLSSTSSGTNRTINITGGTGTTISVADNDNSSSNELQTLSISGSNISLSNGGGTITVPSDADWTASGSNQYSAVSGNVGIGTSTPTQKLHVYSPGFGEPLAMFQAVVDASVRIEGGSGSSAEAYLELANVNASSTHSWGIGMNDNTDLQFNWKTNGTLNPVVNAMTISNTGNVGIGTLSPSAKLDVAGQVKISGGSPGTGKVLTSDASGLATWQIAPADGDGDASNELQTLNQTGNSVTLSNGGGTISVADNDNDASNEIQDLSSASSGTNRTINIAGGTGTTISVADNDNDAANELQTLSLSGSDLSLSNGGGTISLPTDNDWTISGSDQYSGVSGNVGVGTTAPTAKLEVFGTFEAGSINTATGLWSSALGRQNNASGNYSTARGFDNTSSGEFSFASGRSSIASGQNNIAMGSWAESSGGSAIAIGQRVYARSGYETSLGRYNTDYTPNQQFGWDASDRLFSIGNGTSNAARSNALTIYKDGTMNINDAYDMPTADGTSGQVLTTDGSGNATWQDAGGTPPTATYGTAYLGVSSQTLTTTYTNYVSVTLPEAGTYRVFALATVRSTVSPAMVVMAFSSSATGFISNSEFQGHLVQTGGPKYTSSSNEIFVTVTGPTTISLQARYINGVGYLENGSAGRTKLTYMKIAD